MRPALNERWNLGVGIDRVEIGFHRIRLDADNEYLFDKEKITSYFLRLSPIINKLFICICL